MYGKRILFSAVLFCLLIQADTNFIDLFIHNKLRSKCRKISQKFSNICNTNKELFIGIPALKAKSEGVEFILIIYQIRNSLKA